MKVHKLYPQKSTVCYRINEWTSQFGSLIFDGSKGGSIQDTYWYRFENNSTSESKDAPPRPNLIMIYVSRAQKLLQHLDFVILPPLGKSKESDLKAIDVQPYCQPVIDTSTFISSFGAVDSATDETVKYSSAGEQLNIQVIHNGQDTLLLLFGEISTHHSLNEEVHFTLDASSNLTSITIRNEEEIPKLIEALSRS